MRFALYPQFVLQTESDFIITESAASKEQGKQLLKWKQFDIVLLDLIMTPPDYDGLDLAREVLEQNSHKIIMISSVIENEWISNAVQIGMKNIVFKSQFQEPPTLNT
ncbi:response regulator transcription factor [Paenibacillus sp. YN15]|uniref:response regulator transcription factor n=1 Tax=Paenibacillus sp. YN15 TaxID=1742774 RepID=UPI000DCD67CD|nr:hypothetical protein DQG13_27940 [Paenibacillus sp. YN15]